MHLIQVDPTSRGYPAPVGDFAYSFFTNTLYFKIGDGLTDWSGVEADGAPRAGNDLTNASITRNPAVDAASVYTLPHILSANHVLTLGVSGSPVTNSIVQVIRRDLSGFTYTVNDDAGTPLIVFAASPVSAQGATFYFDGTHYVRLNFFYAA